MFFVFIFNAAGDWTVFCETVTEEEIDEGTE